MLEFGNDNHRESSEYALLNRHIGQVAKTRNQRVDILSRHVLRCIELTRKRFTFHHDLASSRIQQQQQELKRNLQTRPWRDGYRSTSKRDALTADLSKLSPVEKSRFLLFRRVVTNMSESSLTLAQLCQVAKNFNTTYYVKNETRSGEYPVPPRIVSQREFSKRALSGDSLSNNRCDKETIFLPTGTGDVASVDHASEAKRTVSVLEVTASGMPWTRVVTLPDETKYLYGFVHKNTESVMPRVSAAEKRPSAFITEIDDLYDENEDGNVRSSSGNRAPLDTLKRRVIGRHSKKESKHQLVRNRTESTDSKVDRSAKVSTPIREVRKDIQHAHYRRRVSLRSAVAIPSPTLEEPAHESVRGDEFHTFQPQRHQVVL